MALMMSQCKKRLVVLWFIGSGFMFLILFLQAVFGKYGDYMRESWEWFLPTVMPSLSLMLSVFIMDALNKGMKTKSVDQFLFWLTFSLSSSYLLIVALTMLLLPFVLVKPQEIIAFLKQSNLWLGPFQGLVSASIGAFFVQKEHA